LGLGKEAKPLFKTAASDLARTVGPLARETLRVQAALVLTLLLEGKIADGLDQARRSVAALGAAVGR
jgi:hypothetical protein